MSSWDVIEIHCVCGRKRKQRVRRHQGNLHLNCPCGIRMIYKLDRRDLRTKQVLRKRAWINRRSF